MVPQQPALAAEVRAAAVAEVKRLVANTIQCALLRLFR